MGRYDSVPRIGDGASPIPVPYSPSELDGDGSRPIPDKVLGSGMPVAPSPAHTDHSLDAWSKVNMMLCCKLKNAGSR
jgi:hypothetical protein